MTLAPQALTTYAAVKCDLDLLDDALQSVVERKINAASAAIERFCSRSFGSKAAFVETVAVPLGINHPAQEGALTTAPIETGVTRLVLSLTPVLTVASVTIDGEVIDPSDYFVEDAAAGFLFNQYGWPSEPCAQIGTARDAVPGFEYPNAVVTYSGGFVLPQYQGIAWAADTAYTPGAVVSQGGSYYVCQTGGTSGSAGPSGASPGAIVDGGVTWLYFGTITLPEDLEEACIITACNLFRARGVDRRVQTDKGGALSTTNFGTNRTTGLGEGGLLPDVVLPTLERYRKLL